MHHFSRARIFRQKCWNRTFFLKSYLLTIFLFDDIEKIKAVFSEENYVPQPSSFVGYIENYGIKLWRPFKQQYSMGRNGHRPKWLWAEMVMDRNGYGLK